MTDTIYLAPSSGLVFLAETAETDDGEDDEPADSTAPENPWRDGGDR